MFNIHQALLENWHCIHKLETKLAELPEVTVKHTGTTEDTESQSSLGGKGPFQAIRSNPLQ